MKFRFRTNLAVLSVSATATLVGGFLVAYPGRRVFHGLVLTEKWYWPVLVVSMGVCGVLIYLLKDLQRSRAFRRILGLILTAPFVGVTILGAFLLSVSVLAFFVPASLVVAYGLWVDEPAPEKATHDLLPPFAAVVSMLLGGGYLLIGSGRPLPFMDYYVLPLVLIGAYALISYVREPRSVHAGVSRWMLAGGFLTFSVSSILAQNPIPVIFYLPLAVLLVSHPLFAKFRLGVPPPEGLTEENLVVSQFDGIAELTAWSVYIFTLLHLYFMPVGVSHAIFGLFVAAYLVFMYQYKVVPSAKASFQRFYRSSMTNAVLLALVSHVTGGLLSPYAWFYVFILIGGSIAPNPGWILHRLYVIVAYFVFETAYSYAYGLLSKELVVNSLLLQFFVVALAGLYAYRLSSRRREIDQRLMATNQELNDAVAKEREARELVTAQSRAIEEVQRRDEAILSSLADGVITLDRSGRIVQFNPAAEGVFGMDTGEMLGRRLRDGAKFKREDGSPLPIDEYVNTALRGNAIPLPDETSIELTDGRRAFIAGAFVPVFDQAKRVSTVVFTLRDVTYLHEVDQMKTDFLSVAAHQLRTPLSSIRWYLELLNDPEEGKLKKNQKLFAENAHESTVRMVNLVNRLLAVTRLEAGRVPIKPAPTDLKAMTEDIVRSLGRKLEERKLDVHVQAPPDLPQVELDPQLSREVFANLVENAVRYTPDGGAIVVEISSRDGELRWSIKDSGIGIPKDQRDKIFEKFFRATNAVQHSAEGSGIGLYLARFIIGTWGGRIWFESEEGRGTTFHVTVPKAGMKPKAGEVSLHA
jgi:PAS domain S-box-containing protein